MKESWLTKDSKGRISIWASPLEAEASSTVPIEVIHVVEKERWVTTPGKRP